MYSPFRENITTIVKEGRPGPPALAVLPARLGVRGTQGNRWAYANPARAVFAAIYVKSLLLAVGT